MKKIIDKIRKWRDRRFCERIDRVYFRRDSKGNHYMYGTLVMLPDKVTGVADLVAYFDGSVPEEMEKHLQQVEENRQG